LLLTGEKAVVQNVPLLANLTIGCFNGLPIIPLDGGHILYAILCMRMQEDKAAKIVRVISFLTLLPLAAAGFYILLASKYNFALLLLSCYLMAMLLLKKGKYD
jgi:stage IV sporulation protein FB